MGYIEADNCYGAIRGLETFLQLIDYYRSIVFPSNLDDNINNLNDNHLNNNINTTKNFNSLANESNFPISTLNERAVLNMQTQDDQIPAGIEERLLALEKYLLLTPRSFFISISNEKILN